ncbi:MAG: hypothetical protein COB67_02280, partial [SAR324 cluster bacterium]
MFTVTFYSYKGGVGRTLCLANAAYTLAHEGAKIVIIDLDLEAPGIDKVAPFNPEQFPTKGGILEYVDHYSQSETVDPENLPSLDAYSYQAQGNLNVRVIPAGKKDQNYQQVLSRINWEELYREKQGFRFFEELKKKIQDEFNPDYLLIDSRTGLADISGITTHQLADLVILLFNLNKQNIEGVRDAYQSMMTAPKTRPVKTLLVASPIPISLLSDHSLLDERLNWVAQELPGAINAWTNDSHGIFMIPYKPQLALDEFTFVQTNPTDDISKAYQRVAHSIQQNNPNDISFLLKRAFQFQKDNLFTEAEEEFQAVLIHAPENAKGYFHYGDFLLKSRNWQEAAAQLQEACRIRPENSDYLVALGTALEGMKHYQTALEKLLEAENINGRNELILQKIAALYADLNNDRKNIEYTQKLNRIQFPPTRQEQIEPLILFAELSRELQRSDTRLPNNFDLDGFIEQFKDYVGMGVQEKCNILGSILEKKITSSQLRQLEKSIRAGNKQYREMFGVELENVHRVIWNGKLESVQNIRQLEYLSTAEQGRKSGFIFSTLLAVNYTEGLQFLNAIQVIKQIPISSCSKELQITLNRFWGGALLGLSNEGLVEDRKDNLSQACLKFEAVLQLGVETYEIYDSFGYALLLLARTYEKGQKPKRSHLKQACEKFKKAIDCKMESDGLVRWGGTLCELAIISDKDQVCYWQEAR